MKDLCAAMGIEWHEPTDETRSEEWGGTCHIVYGCLCEGWSLMENLESHLDLNPSPTDEAFCWRALQYMLHRDDWNDFYYSNQEEWLFRDPSDKNYYSWLFDPARFIELADEWCREHEEVKP